MPNPGLSPVLVVFLSISLFPATQIYAQTVNGLPTCAKECALEIVGDSNCPLNNQTCLCKYLIYYDACVEKECNATDLASANEPPVPYYIPEATISIGTTPSCSLSVPNFPRPTATAAVARASEENNPPSINTKPSSSDSTTASLPISVTRTASKNMATSASSPTELVSPTSGGSRQTSTPLRQTQTADSSSTSTRKAPKASSNGGAQLLNSVDLRVVVAGLLGFAMVVL